MKWPHRLISQIPPQIKLTLEQVFEKNLYVTLVGGATRDFLQKGELPQDLDFEVRADYREFSESEWNAEFNHLKCHLLSNGNNLEELDFNIFRVFFPSGWEVEFSSPREEIFKEGISSHKNFKAIYNANMDYTCAFERRDFTVNAIGIEMRSLTDIRVVDPFAGMDDLKNGVLRACGLNFTRDPVRLLRAIRFKMQTGFSFDRTLKYQWDNFFLAELSNYYIVSEAKKSGDIAQYFRNLFSVIDEHGIPGNNSLTQLLFFSDIPWDDRIDYSQLEQIAFHLCTRVNEVSEINLNNFTRIFGLAKLKIILLRRYVKMLQEFGAEDLETARKHNELIDLDDPFLVKCDRFLNYSRKALSPKRNFAGLLDLFYGEKLGIVAELGLDDSLDGEAEFLEEIASGKTEDEKKGRLRILWHFRKYFK